MQASSGAGPKLPDRTDLHFPRVQLLQQQQVVQAPLMMNSTVNLQTGRPNTV